MEKPTKFNRKNLIDYKPGETYKEYDLRTNAIKYDTLDRPLTPYCPHCISVNSSKDNTLPIICPVTCCACKAIRHEIITDTINFVCFIYDYAKQAPEAEYTNALRINIDAPEIDDDFINYALTCAVPC